MDLLQERIDPVISQAKDQYPILNELPLSFTRTASSPTETRMLESWNKNDKGWDWAGKHYDRPTDLPLDKFGIEILNDKTRPIDILGDVVSHHLVKSDPLFKNYYEKFQNSLTSDQHNILQQQYKHAREDKDSPETRPYHEWYEESGIPAYFRGYAFKQWDNPHELYTVPQMQMFDKMMTHLNRK